MKWIFTSDYSFAGHISDHAKNHLEAKRALARRHSPQQCPELVQIVLQGRTRENNAASTVHLTHLLRDLSNLVLHLHPQHIKTHVALEKTCMDAPGPV